MRHYLRVSLIACSLLITASLLAAQQAATTPPAATLVNAADEQFSADGITIRYRDVGAGDPVLFIHGYTASLESMAGVANALPGEYRKVALDVRGFGRSTKSGDAAQFGQKMVDDVIRLMDHLKIQRAHLVGHSMGALIAANVAARYPSRVSTAALVAGPFWGESDFTTESMRWTTDLERGVGLVNFMKWLFPSMNEQAAQAVNAAVMKTNDRPSLIASMKALSKLSITGLDTDGSKILLVAGTGDPLFPLSTAFARQTRGSRMIEVQGADHVTVITSAEAVTARTAQLHP